MIIFLMEVAEIVFKYNMRIEKRYSIILDIYPNYVILRISDNDRDMEHEEKLIFHDSISFSDNIAKNIQVLAKMLKALEILEV
jgi:hypothetical protein